MDPWEKGSEEGQGPPDRGNLEEGAYRRIRDAILARRLRPGAKLSEPAIARMIDMSRTPVRGALRRLAAEGLVTVTPNQGAMVAVPTPKDIRDAYLTREALEALAARLACGSVTEELLSGLRDAADRERIALRDRSLGDYLEANNRFHLLVARGADNQPLEGALRRCMALTNVYLSLFDSFYEVSEEDLRTQWEHRILIDALRSGDPYWAESAMRSHVRSAFAALDMDRMAEGLRVL